jgi:hypothetical protein
MPREMFAELLQFGATCDSNWCYVVAVVQQCLKSEIFAEGLRHAQE